jgi:myo-inositol 2-dehydrogenase/D-chiro-inositol 1-dehydrogenase
MERLFDSKGFDHKTHNFDTYWCQMLEKNEKWGYLQEDRAFIDAILNRTAPPVAALDGYKSVELVESVYEAIRTGEKIKFL